MDQEQDYMLQMEEMTSKMKSATLTSEGSDSPDRDRKLSDEELKEYCEPILNGKQVPRDILLDRREGYLKPRLCFIHAIRYCKEYVANPEVVSMCTTTNDDPRDAVFTRTYYARLIMNNVVPDMDVDKPETLPYCIWYPDVARESTYREVAKRYPMLMYQVGRACAVAGYTKLYNELDILPEVAIAEEARESKAGSGIYKILMEQPIRYRVMNDYELAILSDPKPAFLNADTAVVALLKYVRPYSTPWYNITDQTFDLLEDQRFGLEHVPYGRDNEFGLEHQWLLYTPLIGDLPPMPDKDLLILMAAYHGNVDRYVRLRRPKMIEHEYACCLRGIYHSTPFAKWWYGQPNREMDFIKASLARFTMMNDISWLEDSPGEVLPYLIWWPVQPQYNTLVALVKREPKMKQAVGHACVFHDFESLYHEIRPEPTNALIWEARYHMKKHFYDDLMKRRAEVPKGWKDSDYEPWPLEEMKPTLLSERRPASLFGTVYAQLLDTDMPCVGPYGGLDPNGCYVDSFMCSSEKLIKKAVEQVVISLPYEDSGEEDEDDDNGGIVDM
ncbi:hypothetical protein QQS21_010358 [Conoideocrella luteorostrata]|uniref:Uncharacterized protein n=1 Tax=Conoideocrella luteorostrata TaxID=1105319 RepID=A0AAJ0CFC3_9HYPO|nr:hypothetical protein QQS21_010358 [Conoideocrella luteorostrata]